MTVVIVIVWSSSVTVSVSVVYTVVVAVAVAFASAFVALMLFMVASPVMRAEVTEQDVEERAETDEAASDEAEAGAAVGADMTAAVADLGAIFVPMEAMMLSLIPVQLSTHSRSFSASCAKAGISDFGHWFSFLRIANSKFPARI